ncbi:MAG TPA: flagellar basal-body rod protein FlgF [Clostridia bacterium]|nr:flagellar basal-body rod protein FlgF [Clostridia bacterium]
MLNRGIYTAATAMLAQSVNNDLIANNLANINTNAYKRDDALHSEFPRVLISQTGGRVRASETLLSRRAALGYLGTGVVVREIFTNHSQGNLRQTEQPLDLAINGAGYFVVEREGEYFFTRDGSFSLNNEGYLVTKQGELVQGEEGPIRLTGDEIVINEKGEIVEEGLVVARLLLVDFQDSSKLTKLGSSLYQQNELSGQPIRLEEGRVVQGFLEGSNVNAVQEMVRLITAARAYESCQKLIQYQDSTLEQAVNDLGRV